MFPKTHKQEKRHCDGGGVRTGAGGGGEGGGDEGAVSID